MSYWWTIWYFSSNYLLHILIFINIVIIFCYIEQLLIGTVR